MAEPTRIDGELQPEFLTGDGILVQHGLSGPPAGQRERLSELSREGVLDQADLATPRRDGP